IRGRFARSVRSAHLAGGRLLGDSRPEGGPAEKPPPSQTKRPAQGGAFRGYREERYVIYGRAVGTSGAQRSAEPRCRGQSRLCDAYTDQKACRTPLARRQADHDSTDRSAERQQVVETCVR